MADEQQTKKLKMHSPDVTEANIDKLAELFPNCVTEAEDEAGQLKRAIDFDQLRQELSDHVVDGQRERYQLNWPGKREALLAANAPIAKTLRPCREESVDFDTTQNLFVEGENLDALKLLQEAYLNKVKIIYIDPPYNTGQEFIYDDDFSEGTTDYLKRSGQSSEEGAKLVANTDANGRYHSDWLSMMYPRLKIARSLLSEEGMIFISIDDNEQAPLRLLCDEVFGRNNFIECFVWKKSYGGGPKEKYAVTQHEYVLMYAKNSECLKPFSLPYEPQKVERYYKGKDEHYSLRGPYRLKPLEATKSMDPRPNLVYDVRLDTGEIVRPQRQWLWSKERVEEALRKNHVIAVRNGNKITLNYKQYLRDENGIERGEKAFSVIDGIYTQHGTSDLSKLFPEAVVVQFPKPVRLIQRFIEIATSNDPNAIVLDFFAGSATTAEACFNLPKPVYDRVKFILIQLPENTPEASPAREKGYATIADIAKERIRRARETLRSQADEDCNRDLGFRVLKVDDSNMKNVYYRPDTVSQDGLFGQVDNIKEDRNDEDLLFQVLLDWGVDLSLPIQAEQIADKMVYFVDEDALAACFEADIDEEFVKALAERKPLRVVFRDNSYGSDSTKINVEQIFRLISPSTEVKTI